MKAGASKIDITPTLPFTLAGSFHIRSAEKIYDPLYSSCIVVESAGITVAFAACDLLALDQKTIEYIRETASRQTGIKPENIIISCTHTHQGPQTVEILPCEPGLDKTQMLKAVSDKIATSIIEAWEYRKSARIGYGKGSVENCGFNRRYIMSDGRARTNPPRGNCPDRLMVEGPVDKEVQVVWFEDMEGKYIAIMVHFSSHPAVLYNEKVVSSDFPGAMRQVIQNEIGKTIPVVYIQGACGNIDTYDFENERTEGLGYKAFKRIGRILGGEVIKVLSQNYCMEQEELDIKTIRSVIDIPFRRSISDEEVEEAIQELNKITEEEAPKKTKEIYRYVSIVRIHEALKENRKLSIEINCVKIGNLIFVSNPAELFVEYQKEIKKCFMDKQVMVIELANGYCGYVPTPQAFALGGYETEFSLGSKLDEKAGRMITDESIKLIKKGGA